MVLHQEPQLRWGLKSGAKAPGGQPLRVTSTKGRAEITASESCRSPQQKLAVLRFAGARRNLPVHYNGPFSVVAISFDHRNRLRRLELILFDLRRVPFTIRMNSSSV